MLKIRATANKLLVVCDPPDEKTKGGLFIPEKYQIASSIGKIVSVGSNLTDKYLCGERILFNKGSACEIEFEGVEYSVVTVDEKNKPYAKTSKDLRGVLVLEVINGYALVKRVEYGQLSSILEIPQDYRPPLATAFMCEVACVDTDVETFGLKRGVNVICNPYCGYEVALDGETHFFTQMQGDDSMIECILEE